MAGLVICRESLRHRGCNRLGRSNSFYGPYWGPSWRYYRGGFWSPWDRWGWGASDFDVRQVDRFEANAEIVLGRGPKPANDPNAFDAREVIQNLGPQVTRPAA